MLLFHLIKLPYNFYLFGGQIFEFVDEIVFVSICNIIVFFIYMSKPSGVKVLVHQLKGYAALLHLMLGLNI